MYTVIVLVFLHLAVCIICLSNPKLNNLPVFLALSGLLLDMSSHYLHPINYYGAYKCININTNHPKLQKYLKKHSNKVELVLEVQF